MVDVCSFVKDTRGPHFLVGFEEEEGLEEPELAKLEMHTSEDFPAEVPG